MSPTGEAAFFEYRDQQGCSLARAVYLRVPSVKVTTCVWRGSRFDPITS